MKRLFIITCLLVLGTTLYAQNEKVIQKVERMKNILLIQII